MRGLVAHFPGRRSSWAVVGAWVVLVAVFAPFGTKIANITNDEYVLPGKSQTARLQQILRNRFPGGDQRPALIVYRHEGGLTPGDRKQIVDDAAAVARIEHVAEPIPPFTPSSPRGLVSQRMDVAFTIVPLEAGKILHVTPTIEALRKQVEGEGALETHVTGFPGIVSDYNSAIKEADFKLLGATVALVLVLLIAVYRSPLLALVPLIVVGVAYTIVTGIVYLLNRATGLAVDASSTALLAVLMFGAGTDYCLLLVSRYGARLRRQDSAEQALREAMPEAAPAMLASGITVIAALLTMLAGIFGVYRTLGPVNALGIAVVLLAGLTLLPALLRLLGRTAYWPNVGAVAVTGVREIEGAHGGWRAVGIRVRRRPVIALGISVAVLLAGASGLFLWKTEINPVKQFRTKTDAARGYDVLRSAFPAGTVNPTSALIERTDGPVRTLDVAGVRRRISAVAGVAAVFDTGRRSTDGRARLLNVVYTDDPSAPPALARTERVREAVASAGPGLHVLVGGGSGERLDVRNAQVRDTKVIIPLVLVVVLTTLIVLLRAVIAPLYLLATVILSFACTLGLTIAIFKFAFGQDGFNTALPLIVFIFLVALGSDYNIFLMSRVREEAARHGTREGTLNALAATGPVITSAGLILAGTFAVLTIIPSWDLSLIGFAVALGVLLDTFLVRSICVPALTWLFAERSWWPSTAEAGTRSTLVTSVMTTRELMGTREPGGADIEARGSAQPETKVESAPPPTPPPEAPRTTD
jgi:RND superfamily putative drug exporter